jgi:prepilin-type processing-associated H-X9-DG protein
MFQCPSDSGISNLQQPSNSGVYTNVTNYVLNTGNTYPVSVNNPGGDTVTGIFYENSFTRIADITDGTSQTICISEQVLSLGNDPTSVAGNWSGVTPSTGFVLTTGNNNTNNGGAELTAANYSTVCIAGNNLQTDRGNRLLYAAPGHTMYNHIRGPNDPGIDCRGGLPQSTRNYYWWSQLSHNIASHSKHVGGVQSLFCDGHVQFISSSIALTIWQGLGSRNGGEVVGQF